MYIVSRYLPDGFLFLSLYFIEFELKNKLAEGKTKEIWEISKTEVIVLSKDRITAWNGAKGHTMVNKSIISNQTTSNIFTILKQAGRPA